MSATDALFARYFGVRALLPNRSPECTEAVVRLLSAQSKIRASIPHVSEAEIQHAALQTEAIAREMQSCGPSKKAGDL